MKKQIQPSTVLFVEYSKGGELQKTVRGVIDRLTPLLGFTMRVTERGGTPLGSLLSNKNLWSGQECGRGECRSCAQSGDRREDCIRRNILYESECTKCSKQSDKGEGGPNIYVGETARSLHERMTEHWKDAEGGKEESHMVEHVGEAHQGEAPEFKFKVVRGFKTSLDRQVAEAIRIEMRGGAALNRRGEFNRCKITRLGIDKEWEKEKWDKAWEGNLEAEIIPDGRDIMETKKSKNINRGKETPCGKRRKMDNTEGIVWGETVEPEIVARNNFLTSNQPNHTTPRQKRQSQLNIITGLEWIAYETVKSVVH